MEKKLLIDEVSLNRILKRIAHEIIEKNHGIEGIIFMGIKTRGYPIAKRIADNIFMFEGFKLPVFSLDITAHRDDIKDVVINDYTDCTIDINGKVVILVDDVFYTGRTIRAALDAIKDIGRASRIELVSIIDRGHRELPIKPDFIGKNIPTSQEEKISLLVKEIDGEDGVYIGSNK